MPSYGTVGIGRSLLRGREMSYVFSMTPYQQVHDYLRRTGKRPKKRLSQNFLIDLNVLPAIVEAAEITDADLVLEIGAGLGCLTRALGEAAKTVVSVEVDANLCAELQREFADDSRIRLLQADILKLNLFPIFDGMPRLNAKVVGNLPYHITTPILWKLLGHCNLIGSCVLMMQKEVAQRIVASPGGKDYGALSVAVSYYASPEIVRSFSSSQFYPAPGVDSSLVRLRIEENPRVGVEDEALFFRILRAAFQYRRKTLRNAMLKGGAPAPIETLDEIFEELGLDGGRRGETLDIREFASLANAVSRKMD